MSDALKYESRPLSLNNKLIVEVYKKEALRSKIKDGFAFVDQKLTLKGLKILVNAKLNDGTLIPMGSYAYIKEETLHTQQWAQKSYESSFFDQPVLIVDMIYVEFIEPTFHVENKFVDSLIKPCTHDVLVDGVCSACGRGSIK